MVIVGVPGDEGPDGTFERTVNLSLRHITSTEVIDGTAPAAQKRFCTGPPTYPASSHSLPVE
jgi:hypothetical protein